MPKIYKNRDVSNGSPDITVGHDPKNPNLGMMTRAYKGVSKGWHDMSVDSRKKCVDKMDETKKAAVEKEAGRLRVQKCRASKTVTIPVTPPPTHRDGRSATAPARRARMGGRKLTHFDEHQALQSQVNNNRSDFDRITKLTLGIVEANAGMAQNLEGLRQSTIRTSQNLDAFQQQQMVLNQQQGEAIQQQGGRVSALEESGQLQHDWNWDTNGRIAELERMTGLTPPRSRR